MKTLDEYIHDTEAFVFMEDEPAEADVIFIPGNGFPQMAEKAAELYGKGLAPYVLPSGKYSITAGRFGGVQAHQARYPGPYETEWDFLRDVLMKNGVPGNAVLWEEEATYTWQNALFSRRVTDRKGIMVRRALLCCRNVHSRRAWMYYSRAFPEAEIRVIPVSLDGMTRQNWTETEEGISAVMAEAGRIITQFSLYMD